MGVTADGRRKDIYLRIKQINQEIGEPAPGADGSDDLFHGEIIERTHIRVVWQPKEANSSEEGEGFKVVLPILLSMEGNHGN